MNYKLLLISVQTTITKMMTPQAVVTFSVYFGLVAVGLIFVGGSLMAFWEEKTHLLMSTETVRGSDNPTLTICFFTSGEPQYGTDFLVDCKKQVNGSQSDA